MAVASNSIDNALRTLFKRCVLCPSTTPSCPSCKKNEVCSLISQSCSACASTTCIKSETSSDPTSPAGPNVGAIAGGVAGGIAVVALATFLVWWFFIRGKRARYEEEWEEEDDAAQKQHEQFNMQRSERASVHTVNSVATSLLSRASNMIPIAYIPGIMNREGRNNSNLNTPPVPPIPAVLGPHSAHSSNAEALFFKPGDLRDSTYSDTSSLGDRSTFYGRPSITPSLARSSMATFRDDAVENPMPAQTIIRAKANMVSLDTSRKTSPEANQQLEFAQPSELSKPNIAVPAQSSSAVKLNGVSFGKPTLLTLTKKSKGRFPVKNGNPAQGAKPVKSSPLAYRDDYDDDDYDDDSENQENKPPPPPSSSTTLTPIHESPMATQSPFADPIWNNNNINSTNTDTTNDCFIGFDDIRFSRQSEQSFIGMGGLKSIAEVSSIIENATKRASRGPSHMGLGDGAKDEESPFGDEHELK